MARSIMSGPDVNALLPSLALLSPRGALAKLEQLNSSYFARYEKVCALKEEAGASADVDRDVARRLEAEEAMLKQVLDWLKLRTGE